MYAPFADRKESHDEQGQELEEEHGEEASSEDAEGKASGEEGQEVATPVHVGWLTSIRRRQSSTNRFVASCHAQVVSISATAAVRC